MLRSKKYDWRSFVVKAETVDGAEEVFAWRFTFGRDVLALYPVTPGPVKGKVYLRVDYLVSPSPLGVKSELLVLNCKGKLLARLDLRPPGDVRLHHDVKIGPKGSVFQLVVRESGTEVLKWTF